MGVSGKRLNHSNEYVIANLDKCPGGKEESIWGTHQLRRLTSFLGKVSSGLIPKEEGEGKVILQKEQYMQRRPLRNSVADVADVTGRWRAEQRVT